MTDNLNPQISKRRDFRMLSGIYRAVKEAVARFNLVWGDRTTHRKGHCEMTPPAHDELNLRRDLEIALADDQLRLDYQPKGRTKDQEVVGFEALVRWQHPQLGLIGPSLFIPMAEKHGLIYAVGEWVLRAACREAATWSKPLRIAANVSALQFRDDAFPTLVASVLMQTGLAPQRLELEITETAFLEDFSRAAAVLAQFRSLGVQIAIDDFGTGYSNLSLVQSLSLDRLKIDGSFIGNLDCLPQSAAIVRAVIGLAHSLDIGVTAECVETEDQRAFLIQENCDEIQGYLLGRPESIGTYRKIVSASPKGAAIKLAHGTIVQNGAARANGLAR